jgi:hypothetical protein
VTTIEITECGPLHFSISHALWISGRLGRRTISPDSALWAKICGISISSGRRIKKNVFQRYTSIKSREKLLL